MNGPYDKYLEGQMAYDAYFDEHQKLNPTSPARPYAELSEPERKPWTAAEKKFTEALMACASKEKVKDSAPISPDKKEPGQITYEALVKGVGHLEASEGKEKVSDRTWAVLADDEKATWESVESAARRPLAIQVYNARRALARLLVTYRFKLQGNWYDQSTVDAGMELDSIGHIKGPYKHDAHDQFCGPEEVERIIKS